MLDRVENRVKELRLQHALTQEGLGEALGVSRQTIISIENGRYVPSLQLALRISRFFGLPTDALFTLVD